MAIEQIQRFYRNGYMTLKEAIDALLVADPVRFQRQRHTARDFLLLNY